MVAHEAHGYDSRLIGYEENIRWVEYVNKRTAK
jgi:hypothetical protein